jgi:two-component system, NarL family, nitrate/nitrite response regulator NarL
MPVDVLLVDDHAAVREGLRLMIETSKGFRVVGQAGNHREALEFLERNTADLIVMDVSLPGVDGIDATRDILRRLPSARIVMLSMYDDQPRVLAALRAGARGYILKSAAPSDVLDGLRLVSEGVTYFSPAIAGQLLERIQRGSINDDTSAGNLTRRELQVLRLVGEGKTNREAATELNLETGTVRAYRKNLMRKLDARNAATLTKVAVSMGLVHVSTGRRASVAAVSASRNS